MARPLNQREKTLLAALVVAGLAAFWLFSGGEEPPDAAGGTGKDQKGKLRDPAPVVRMELVDRDVDPFEEGGRDLFKYTQRPPSARELARLRAEAAAAAKEAERLRKLQAEQAERERERAAAEALVAASRPPPPPPEPTPPFIPFKYIGYLGPKNDRIAVFDDGGETILAKKGETVQEQFRVVDIKYDSVVMGYVRTEFRNDRRELPLSGKGR